MTEKERNFPDVYLHIGLAKTATTSLQASIFPQLSKYVDYIGVAQPRSLLQDSLYAELLLIIGSRQSIYDCNRHALSKKISDRLLSSDKPLFISDEMITIDNTDACWQEKLGRLGELFNDFNIKIIVTVREPISASYSLYVELYHEIKNDYPSFNHFFYKSNQALIYRYEQLHEVIFNSFSKKTIKYVSFEKIVKEVNATDFIEELLERDILFNLPMTNSKLKSKKDFFTTYFTVTNLLFLIIPRFVMTRQRRFLPSYSYISYKNYLLKKNIPAYSERENREMKMTVIASNNVLKSICDIDYNKN